MKPRRTENAHATEADFDACCRLLHQGSKSFHLASKLLPQRARKPASALYAFCRLADDAIDLGEGGQGALDALSARLDRIYLSEPADDAVERALSDTVAGFDIPRELLDALIEGLAWDEQGRRYQDIAELHAYSARVASTVGVITTLIMGVRAPDVLARAADLGVAMQMTNIARDVGEDARAGRLYLPMSWMRDAGLCPEEWLAQPVFDDRLGGVVERLLQQAGELYQRSMSGIGGLPRDCRTGIHAARLIYAEIGEEVARRGFDSVNSRAVVSPSRKLRLLASAFKTSMLTGQPTSATEASLPPLDETRFLIDAVTPDPSGLAVGVAAPNFAWWAVRERLAWTIELFARLAIEERMQRSRH